MDMSNGRGVLTVRFDDLTRQILRQRTLIVTNDVTRTLLCARITCYVSYNTPTAMRAHNVLCNSYYVTVCVEH
jgi:hypothetical protein